MAKEALKLWRAERIRVQLTREQQKQIRAIYKEALQDVKGALNRITDSDTVSESLKRDYLNTLERQLTQEYRTIGAKVESTVQNNTQRMAQAVVDEMGVYLKKIGVPIISPYSYVPSQIVEAISSGQIYEKGWSLSGAIWGDVRAKQHDIQQIIAKGVAENKGAYDIAKDLEKYVDPSARKPWDWSKVYPGSAKVIDYNAQRLARTLVSHAYQESLERTCKDNPFIYGYIWHKNSDVDCDICEARENKFFEKGDLPLDHPNGMCTFEIVIDNFDYQIDRMSAWVGGANDPELDRWMEEMEGIS